MDALPSWIKPAVVKAFEKFKVLNERELHARYDIDLETYCKTINIEGQLMVLDGQPVHPAGGAEVRERDRPECGGHQVGGGSSPETKKLLDCVSRSDVDAFKRQTDALAKALDHNDHPTNEKHARHMRDTIVPAMEKLRELGIRSRCLFRTRSGRCRRTARCCSSSRNSHTRRSGLGTRSNTRRAGGTATGPSCVHAGSGWGTTP